MEKNKAVSGKTGGATFTAGNGQERKKFGAPAGGRLWLAALGSSLVALLVYGLTLSKHLHPGTTSDLYVQWMGLDTLSLPLHPLWAAVVTAFGGGSATAVNVLALAFGVLSAGFLCYLTGFFVFQTIGHEDTSKFAGGASLLAGITAAFAFTFSTAAWSAATHLDVRQFDVFLALSLFMLYVPLARFRRLTHVLSAVLGFAAGACLLESPIFIPLLAVCLLALVATAVKNGVKFYIPTLLFLVALAGGFAMTLNGVTGAFLRHPGVAGGAFEGTGDVLWAIANVYKQEMHDWLFRQGGLIVVLLAVLPFIACAFAAPRGLNNERNWSQYAFHLAMTVCCVLATATPLAPESLMRQFGVVPVATTALVAMVCGYLMAYWYLTARAPLPAQDAAEHDASLLPAIKTGRKAAPVAGGIFAALLLLAALVGAFSRDGERGAFADACANEIIDRMGERTWLVTDGLLDAHLRIAAAARNKELNIVCIKERKETEYKAYCKQLADLVVAKKISAGDKTPERLSFILRELGMVEFLKAWFASDPDVAKKVSVFRMPDFWFWAKCRPVPDCLVFNGATDVKKVDGLKAKADFLEFWKKMEPVLHAERNQGSRSIYDLDDLTDRRRLELRRHVGFVANNLAVLLQDQGHDADAFELYELVLNTIDCDNICALFNEYEMARVGKKEAQPHRKRIEQSMKDIVNDESRRYNIKPLSSYYGYVRSPEFFVRSGLSWAKSGETGYALEQIKYAIDLAPGDSPPQSLMNMMASYYAQGRQSQKSREMYDAVLKKDAENHEALIGLWRLALQEGKADKARQYLERAMKAAGDETTKRMDTALMQIMDNKLEEARVSLQKVSDLMPHSLQTWGLLASVMLQQADATTDKGQKRKIIETIEGAVLPKMEGLAESPRDFFVQTTRAFVLLRKGDSPELLKQARTSLEIAWSSRPDVNIGSMVLELDYKLLDRKAAELHAVQILRMDSRHAFANWVMGSIRMDQARLPEAETYLRAAVESDQPLPAALNDLAELCRKQKRFQEAEVHARAATKAAPQMYVGWETLCAALLDQNKNLAEAETCIQKAIDLSKGADRRMQITLARVQIAKNDFAKARATLRELSKHVDELAESDRNEFERLEELADNNGKASGGK